ncbi:phosphoglucosamine mutase [Paroceanicella profunda]|uniref:Phosphoglucosamine mutase n=1 Tax=Paroceanicella profunda TaxID=2579971 RepID=A0A5B8FZK3_9RHOB|nr:phosphoglucosamine mutase [Paroceanicella profunda]QDL92820.1 phosphoglucosamine mutase [Paroceanicella profunda]
MTRKLFGTDGVRGRANSGAMTAEMAMRLGMAAGRYFRNGHQEHRVIIGKDTRRSGYMLETAMTAGFTSVGMNVFLLGPMPTPAVAMLTRSLRADLGVMISASHNPFEDNGIKFFGPDGYKLSDAAEAEIEGYLAEAPDLSEPSGIGRAKRIDVAYGRYTEFAKTTFPRGLRLDGLKIVLDCAHGAAYRTAPEVLWELGAEVITLGTAPDGFNINAGVGSTHPEAAQALVLETGADIGIALDGDADRVHVIDETGRIIDGDQIMGLIASRWAGEGRLRGGALVATVMSNLGLERFLAGRGIGLRRTRVGDRYVVEDMRQSGCNLGGEQSGHIVMSDYTTTGDGLIAALQILATLVETVKPLSEIGQVFTPVPQLLKNMRYTEGTEPLETDRVKAAIAAGEVRLGSTGRLVIRRSGTEPLVRVMGEAEDPVLLEDVVDSICDAVARAV